MFSIKTIRINSDSFDLKCFVRSTLGFVREIGGSDLADTDAMSVVVQVDDDYRAIYPGSEDRDIRAELSQGKGLFFPYSTTNANSNPILCADGRVFRLIERWERAEDLYYLEGPGSDDDDDDYDEVELSGIGSLEAFPMYKDDYIGFLIRLEDDVYVIETAVSVSSQTGMHFPTVSVREDCHIFDQFMAEYLLTFMTAKCTRSSLPPVPADEIIATDDPFHIKFGSDRDMWVN